MTKALDPPPSCLNTDANRSSGGILWFDRDDRGVGRGYHACVGHVCNPWELILTEVRPSEVNLLRALPLSLAGVNGRLLGQA